MEELPRIYSGEGILSARQVTRTGLPLHCRSPSDFAGYVGETEAFPKACAALRHLIAALSSWRRSNGIANAGQLDFRQSEETWTERASVERQDKALKHGR